MTAEPERIVEGLDPASAFWLVVPSSTSNSSCGASSALPIPASPSSSSSIGDAIASAGGPVCHITTVPRALLAVTATNITAAGSPPACWITVTLLRSPQIAAAAAAWKVSFAASSWRPCCCGYLASLMLVVLPAPLTPAIDDEGRFSRYREWLLGGCSRSVKASTSMARIALAGQLQRLRRSSSRCCVAAMPQSATIRLGFGCSSVFRPVCRQTAPWASFSCRASR